MTYQKHMLLSGSPSRNNVLFWHPGQDSPPFLPPSCLLPWPLTVSFSSSVLPPFLSTGCQVLRALQLLSFLPFSLLEGIHPVSGYKHHSYTNTSQIHTCSLNFSELQTHLPKLSAPHLQLKMSAENSWFLFSQRNLFPLVILILLITTETFQLLRSETLSHS